MGDALTIYAAEPLRDPVLVLSYAGWSDGGDAATTAARSLLQRFSMTRYAAIDSEDFLDFTVMRPQVRVRDGEHREIVWPDHEFFVARLEVGSSDLLVGLGVEPHLRWRAYAKNILELVDSTKARLVVLMGAYLDEVIYSQPVQVSAYGAPHELFQGLELATPSYEGPTGILGVLADALRREGVPMASLWARIPHYVPTRPNARGALALLQALEGVAGLRLDLSELEREAAAFDDTVSRLITTDPQLSAYVKELKRRVFTQ